MTYRTKVYVAFDGKNDIHYYRILMMWNENEDIDFDFNDAHELEQCRDSSQIETIRSSLRRRLKSSKLFILLIGEHTKNKYKFVKWEIETAMEMEIPIICVNLNKSEEEDDLSPACLNNYPAIYVPFEMEPIKKAIKIWPDVFEECINSEDTTHYSSKDLLKK